MMTKEELKAGAEQVKLDLRNASLPEVDALLQAGWKFELPEIVNNWKGGETEPWAWYWRRPPRRKNSKGQKFWSTTQAYNALMREKGRQNGHRTSK